MYCMFYLWPLMIQDEMMTLQLICWRLAIMSGCLRPSSGEGLTTPSTARRQQVLRHAAASHVALSGLLERPVYFSSASSVLSDIEQHLNDAGKKQARWRGMTDMASSSQRLSAGSTASIEEAIHVSLLCRELHALEDGVLAKGSSALQELRQRASDLEQELAAGAQTCRHAKEDLATSQRAVLAKSAALERAETETVREKSRCGALMKQLAEVQGERYIAVRRLESEVAGRADVQARLTQTEQTLTSSRE